MKKKSKSFVKDLPKLEVVKEKEVKAEKIEEVIELELPELKPSKNKKIDIEDVIIEEPEIVEVVAEEEVEIEEVETKEPEVDLRKTRYKTEDTEVYVKPPEEEKKKELVKIKLKNDHRCNIGGEWYHFKKEKITIVPQQVRELLLKSGLLLPL
jgi:hypothetical protein